MAEQVSPDGLDRAGVQAMDVCTLIAAASRLLQAGNPAGAALLYRTWLEHNSGDRLRHAAAFNLGVILSEAGDRAGADAALAEAIAGAPEFLPPYINRGTVLEGLGRPAEAVAHWQGVVNRLAAVTGEAIGLKTTALRQLGRVLGAAHLDAPAEQALRHSLEVAPQQRDMRQHWLSLRQRQCEWPVIVPLAGLSRAELVRSMSPLSLAAHTDDPLLQLSVAADYARRDVGRPDTSFAHTHAAVLREAGGRVRVGYLSSDLREHAIGHLMAELFALHDAEQVEVFAYYCGPAAGDAMHARFKATAHVWVDIGGMDDGQAAQRIADDRIQILVDVNGYTHSARGRVLAMRPAPVIVNWLGFPNTTGSPYHTHIIADPVIIPPGHERFYSETVLRLPCYQPNNRARIVAPPPESRVAAGLPADGVVYCCFNAAHKITPFTWARWMAILRDVPDSVLWLLDGVPSTNDRLRAHAAAADIDPLRLVFAPKLANAWHLARYPLADLFLDTAPYGAHTTGSDALWMGVPVLTLPGRSFASRVCSSLVTAAGLPEMVCRDGAHYVARGIELGRDPAQRADLRARLVAQRDRCTLFDTPHLVRSLEALFREVRQQAAAGGTARPDLQNLDIYGEIGAELDSDVIEAAERTDHDALYQAGLAERDLFGRIPPDRRGWAGGA